MPDTKANEMFKLIDDALAEICVGSSPSVKPLAIYGITPIRFHKVKHRVLEKIGPMAGKLVIVDIRKIFTEKENALRKRLEAEYTSWLIDEIEGEFIGDEYNEYDEYDEYDEAAEYYSHDLPIHNVGTYRQPQDSGSSGSGTPITKLQAINHQWQTTFTADNWHVFAEDCPAPYALAHDTNYEGRILMNPDFEIHVYRTLQEKYQWSLLCIEPGYEYWKRTAVSRLEQIIQENFLVLDLSEGLSPIERRLKEALDSQKIEYVSQYEIHTTTNVYKADFQIRSGQGKLIIECDGKEFHSTPYASQYDRSRQQAIEALGYRVLRFTGTEIWNDLDGCVAAIKRAMW